MFVRSAAHVIKSRRRSEQDHGRPRDLSHARRLVTARREHDRARRECMRWIVLVRSVAYDRFVGSSGKRTRGPNKQAPWSRQADDGVSVLRLALDFSDPVQRTRIETIFQDAYSL